MHVPGFSAERSLKRSVNTARAAIRGRSHHSGPTTAGILTPAGSCDCSLASFPFGNCNLTRNDCDRGERPECGRSIFGCECDCVPG
jgi:hypothetical protein